MSSDRTGATSARLWCVLLVPVLQNDPDRQKQAIVRLLKGPGDDMKAPRALCWTVQAAQGFADNREPSYLHRRQRLVVFESSRDAARAAREASNEFWIGQVREVRIVQADALPGRRNGLPTRPKRAKGGEKAA